MKLSDMKLSEYFFIIILLLSVGINKKSRADVKLPGIFGSNMVLQEGTKIPVWGWASPGERISVTFNGAVQRIRAGSDGKWSIDLPPEKYGGPFTLTVKGKNTITLKNVMVGEVWVCSGQSNMEFRVNQSINAAAEVRDADYPDIRLFTVPDAVAQFPKDDIDSGKWVECSPKTVESFSAVGYFFGRNLLDSLHVAIGLIHSSWGGTVAETWMSPNSIQNDPDFKGKLAELQKMDMDRYRQEKIAQIKKILGGELPQNDKALQDSVPEWSAYDFNDGSWKTIRTPGLWEEQGYLDIDGVGWYRKEIMLASKPANTNLTLHLGKIDDSDITWMNGIEVGSTEGYNKDRIYTIDSKYIRPGKNMLVIRVNDTGGGGGIYGNPADEFIAIGDKKTDISGDWKFKISRASVSSANLQPNSYPTLLYNAMINPLIPYAIRGVIWYQGESNADRAKQYQRIFPELINDWRKHWGEGDFPFLFVSLANYMQPDAAPSESDWAELREAQTKTLSLPNTGMALAIDIGNADDIHPKNKQEVGRRLALNALKIAYNHDVVNSGPMYKSVEFKDGKAFITFDDTGNGLIAKNKYGYINGFAVAGSDKVFHWARASLHGNNQVVVYSDVVNTPVAVRYGWANNPDDLNLYNSEGLPANPFRTDNWPRITR